MWLRSHLHGTELFIGHRADVVRLQPVEDLLSELSLESCALHPCLAHENLRNEELGEAVFDFVIHIEGSWHEFLPLDLRASLWLTRLRRGLVTMSHVKAEHKLVSDLIEERDVGTELCIVDSENLSQVNLNELVELFSALLPV